MTTWMRPSLLSLLPSHQEREEIPLQGRATERSPSWLKSLLPRGEASRDHSLNWTLRGRLTSERGLPALRTLFDNVHFKGKGHEAEDLRVLMQRMENWAHRLYPKLQFEDFIDKLETLGSKKEVQTCLKRIRLDMPLIHEDFIGNDGDDDAVASSDGRVVNHDDPDPFGDGGFAENPPGPAPSQFLSSQAGPVHSTPAPSQFLSSQAGPVHSTPAPSQFLSSQAGPVHSTPAPSQFLSSQAGPVHSTPAPSLTEEQQRRIELNKQLALERRLARVQQHTGGSQEMTSSQSADGPSTSQSQEMTSSQSADGPSTSQSQEMTSSQSADGPSTSQSQEMTSSQSADGPSKSQSQEMTSSQSADRPSTSQSQEMTSSQSADGPSTSQSQEMTSSQSADGPSTSSASSSHPFPSQQQQDGEDEDPDPEDQGQSRPDHPRDRALNTASPAEADSLSPDSLLCEGAVASQPCS
ncbi:TIMELESS-interacting protein isoform X2 [Coregonus clupeaformis]|uniref:TIMELESS-interacting protein isoform X2 n=1 Tax=Coregonus clupeaformis TaxID=59861 RepID=UPI001E1C93DD|nr:TIMELESS-interacting protein isoform X2 [Coregonus clupeaformis]XP_045081223.1 TIMELESS-interacting protein isoform X2 [Coregonus clupeaformis]XP_045081224.1 TIMELESS-interacting protein isoform X2 [Coregonus clupeaformis]XP_045081225.1 TIMELESS-interacting protein isoform X2 [Coregonus clupeaformis]